MLILSRKADEGIVIGENIHIKVISIDRGSVKLGFDAPPHTLILRSELKEAITSENKKASNDIAKDALTSIGKAIKH
ncbi:carbon storage regulator [Helicobacter sp. 12S02634-8]|uniref:carbon storage regulator n=1 Tax=Helicobacter sp. 12S02634-8 TaxID=1476199 RepID=UPI000BA694B0|nr:carbon storage regulator [Helicobacter sp. 12S02634-8]PAF48024.1 carbon storage regulator [Helicobacter sp. 12S02634-8]